MLSSPPTVHRPGAIPEVLDNIPSVPELTPQQHREPTLGCSAPDALRFAQPCVTALLAIALMLGVRLRVENLCRIVQLSASATSGALPALEDPHIVGLRVGLRIRGLL